MESKTLNMVVIHKQSKWSKFKRRLGGWFSSDKVGSEALNLPQIIVTSAEESSGPPDEKRHSYDPAPQPPNSFKKAEQGDLAKAHQNVIAEMRNSLAQARGAGEVSQTSEAAKRMSVASEQGTGHTFIMIDGPEIRAADKTSTRTYSKP